ncbi:methyltransferase [Peptostreptococcus faecalis]|uniref:methyltransferase n=1 Tax=Peptostreptococcus faecalis TaxID=2045015 RepID=UPI000C7DA709|nr:methyltransferase [Peptostreptococcus faecalis]
MRESCYDRLLNIDTLKHETRMDKYKYYNRYEPTPYSALEKLFENYEVSSKDHFVDFGSGKGRFSFFVNFYFNASCTGVEIADDFYKKSIHNLMSYKNKKPRSIEKLFFVKGYAEKYEVSTFENKFYFFNPFTVNIFIAVVNNIIKSFEEKNRTIDIILYYPSSDYINFLERKTFFTHVKDITLANYEDDPREKFSIYRLSKNFDVLSEEDIASFNVNVTYQKVIIYKQKK